MTHCHVTSMCALRIVVRNKIRYFLHLFRFIFLKNKLCRLAALGAYPVMKRYLAGK